MKGVKRTSFGQTRGAAPTFSCVCPYVWLLRPPPYLNNARNCEGMGDSNSMRSRVMGCQKHST